VHRWALLLLLVLSGFLLIPVPVVMAGPVAGSVVLTAGVVDRRGWLDVDGDGLADVVEEGLCGSASCARAGVDSDGDGVGDGVEFLACGSAGCVTPVDVDGDCMPDYVPLVLCDGGECSQAALYRDVDRDGVQNWVEVVVAGSAWLADGVEDFNGDGLSDVGELLACEPRAESGGVGEGDDSSGWAAGLAGAVIGFWMVLRRRRRIDPLCGVGELKA
jgi:hypothetical protein